MQIAQRKTVERLRLNVLDQQLDGALVVENHLRLHRILAARGAPVLDQLAGIEQRVGVALDLARRPRQINQQAFENGAAVGAGRCRLLRRFADAVQPSAQWRSGAGKYQVTLGRYASRKSRW